MDISSVGNGNYYIIIGSDEMRGRDVTELLRKNIPTLSKDLFLEIFTGTDGAIVFARACRGSPIVFSFSDIEALISAAGFCDGAGAGGTLLAFEADEYRLIFYPCGNEPAPAPLYEFCVSSSIAHPDYQRHICEQGQMLLGPCAIEQLREMFG